MLRVSRTTAEHFDGQEVLRLEGQVSGPWVEELRRVCADALGNNRQSKSPLVLDLAGVSFLDADGVALFHELEAQRVLLTHCSAFVAEQLKGRVDDDK